MGTAIFIYHLLVLLITLMVFFIKITAPGVTLELFTKLIIKLEALYCILYSGIEIFKYFKIF